MGETNRRAELIIGAGRLASLPEAVRDIGAVKVMLITDRGLVEAGHVRRAVGFMEGAGIEVEVYDEVCENPTESSVGRCANRARKFSPDCLVGLGGGSSLDTAKSCLFLLSGGGVMSDYQGHGKGKGEMLPLIAVPTTAGTGSECQSYAVLCRDGSHEKMACGDERAMARVAILDSDLTASMPRQVARLTALDALSHVLESYVCSTRTEQSMADAQEAFELIFPVIEKVVMGEAEMGDREAMLIGSAKAGCSIEASMLGAAHASANPLTAKYDLVHGHAVITTLPSVMRWNLENEETRDLYMSLSQKMGLDVEGLIQWVERLRNLAGFSGFVFAEEDVAELAGLASRQWTGQFNPRPLTEADYAGLYRSLIRS